MAVFAGRLAEVKLSTDGSSYIPVERVYSPKIMAANDLADISSNDSGGNKEFLVTEGSMRVSWSMVADETAQAQEILWTAYRQKEQLWLQVLPAGVEDNTILNLRGVVTRLGQTSLRKDAARYEIEFTVSGFSRGPLVPPSTIPAPLAYWHMALIAMGLTPDAAVGGARPLSVLGSGAATATGGIVAGNDRILLPGSARLQLSPALTVGSAFTLTTWFAVRSPMTDRNGLWQLGSGGSQDPAVRLLRRSNTEFRVGPHNTTDETNQGVGPVLATDVMHCLVVHKPAGDAQAKARINGGADLNIGDTVRNITNPLLNFGIHYDGFGNIERWLNGYVSEAALWDVELPSSKLAEIYTRGAAGLPITT